MKNAVLIIVLVSPLIIIPAFANANAEVILHDWALSPSTAHNVGDTVHLIYLVNNTGPTVTIGLGMNIKLSAGGSEAVLAPTPTFVSLQSGLEKYESDIVIPTNMSAGTYDVSLTLWDGYPGKTQMIGSFKVEAEALTILKNLASYLQNTKPIEDEDGGYVSALRTTDEDGQSLNITYVAGDKHTLKSGDIIPACVGPDNGLHQEGIHWNLSTSNPNIIGFSVKWKMPRGTISGTHAGIIYNPLNFYVVSNPSQGENFFQVDYGIGKVDKNVGFGITTSETGQNEYNHTSLYKMIDVIPGEYYRIDAAIQDSSMSSYHSVYVVQLTKGRNAWITSDHDIAKKAWLWTPRQHNVESLHSFQDEYIKSPFKSDLTADEVIDPAVIINSGRNSFQYGTSQFTPGELIDNTRNINDTTYGILTPRVSQNPIKLENVIICDSSSRVVPEFPIGILPTVPAFILLTAVGFTIVIGMARNRQSNNL